ncbi:MAG: hypothetical protein RIS88_229 [Pseudomonadota bacterium]|jgi:hypothetical protein
MARTVLLLMLSGWTALSLWVAHRVGPWWEFRHLPGGVVAGLQRLGQVLVLAVLLPLPLIDELLAQAQFEHLCREQIAVQVQGGATAPQALRYSVSAPEPVPGLPVPVSRRAHRYTDPATQQTLVTFSTFQAHAGKLARLAGQPEEPLTFAGHCGPPDPRALLARSGVPLNGPELPAGLAISP